MVEDINFFKDSARENKRRVASIIKNMNSSIISLNSTKERLSKLKR